MLLRKWLILANKDRSFPPLHLNFDFYILALISPKNWTVWKIPHRIPSARFACHLAKYSKTCAIIERSEADAFDVVGDCDISEAGAIIERFITDACDAIWDRHTRKVGAIIERIITNACDAIRNRHTRKASTIFERMINDAYNTIGYNNLCYKFSVQIKIVCII